MPDVTVLRPGSTGPAVRDLQMRLATAGFGSVEDELGLFGGATRAAVVAFQEERRIRVDGIAGPETWAALVESGFELGDRLLYHRTPNLRGDDVLRLQELLNRLGFDAGRQDGILGPETDAALREFQRNMGITLDGIAGPATLDQLTRVSALAGGSVNAARERAELRQPRRLADRRIYLAVAPGFEQIGSAVGRSLNQAGAQVMTDTSGSEDSALAQRANRWNAELFIAIRAGDRAGAQCLYFASGDFRSELGYRVAGAVDVELRAVLGGPEPAADGRAYALLRETRMAAVVCALVEEHDVAGMASLLTSSTAIAMAVARGVRRGFEEVVEDPAASPTA